MDNKKIPTWLGVVIIIIFSFTIGTLVLKWARMENINNDQILEKLQNDNIQSMTPAKSDQQAMNTKEIVKQKSSINWAAKRFDVCGGKTKYEQMPWWNKFSAEIEKIDYYSDSYIESQIKSLNDNSYLNPKNITYTYQTYCNDKKFKNFSICKDENKKLSINDFNNYGKGCLSKDGSVFIAVFPGEYLGGGNHIFRYDIFDNVLENAEKIDEIKTYGSAWIDPPQTFGKKIGNIIKMNGKSGDAGCSSNTDFDYDIAANQIKMTKRCTQCMGEKSNCNTF